MIFVEFSAPCSLKSKILFFILRYTLPPLNKAVALDLAEMAQKENNLEEIIDLFASLPVATCHAQHPGQPTAQITKVKIILHISKK
jgi:hypothetical protein